MKRDTKPVKNEFFNGPRITIKKSFSLSGIGLHNGERVNICFKPFYGCGIFFKRVDLRKKNHGKPCFVKASVENIINTNYSIDLSKNGVLVRSVEHVLASLFGLGIDDCIIELDNEELPALDGSGEVIVKNILKAGFKETSRKRKIIVLKKPVAVSTNGSCIIAVPDKNFKISVAISYRNKFIGTQYGEFNIYKKTFINEIACARTFGWLEEIEREKKKGLIKGGSLDNALVYSNKGLVNKEKQKFKDEPVRHKIFDLMGALAFLPGRLNAHIAGIRTGHTIDIAFVKEVLK